MKYLIFINRQRKYQRETARARQGERERGRERGREGERCGCHMLFEAEARKKPKLPLNSLAIIIKHKHIHTKEKKRIQGIRLQGIRTGISATHNYATRCCGSPSSCCCCCALFAHKLLNISLSLRIAGNLRVIIYGDVLPTLSRLILLRKLKLLYLPYLSPPLSVCLWDC